MPLNPVQRAWYFEKIAEIDPMHEVVRGDPAADQVHYSAPVQTDKSHTRNATPEELVHALAMALLVKHYGYPATSLYHEKDVYHGSSGSSSDEIDLVINDADGLPFAVWEFKSSEDYAGELERATQYQLFGTVPLLTSGSPRHIVCATIDPNIGSEPVIKIRCIDYSQVKDYALWVSQGCQALDEFPRDYRDPSFVPYVKDGEKDLRTNCTLTEFRAVATQFHNEFFSEHPDNQLFESLVKLLLAKISSEKNTPTGEEYAFQIFYRNGRPETAAEVFGRISQLYDEAYTRYIDPTGANPLDPNTFSHERVKSVVSALQGMALTRGSALSADIMGAFFEEILRAGFKQDRGMYFTHDNIARFMAEAVGLRELTKRKWRRANHPNNRLPYVIDPACGSGTFLLHSMQLISNTIREGRAALVRTEDEREFFRLHLSDVAPNAWARDFLYGFDYKFIMALTAKVNMVLHGDGVTHIFKEDSFKPLSAYTDTKFRPVDQAGGRTLTQAQYDKPMCESFDVVISNPPFGVTLSPETRASLSATFSLPPSNSTEALFVERAFQLLRPHGRLAVVLPESVLNAAENIEVRKLLYRFFHIRAVVLLPRNIFVDTPTLTSLLFAQKKPASAVERWDTAWGAAKTAAEAKISAARAYTKAAFVRSAASAADVERGVLAALGGIATADSWVTKSGARSRVLTFHLPPSITTAEAGAAYYKDILFGAGFDAIVDRYVLEQVAAAIDYDDWACYTVSEVGFKLSKRKEKARENQLMSLRAMHSGQSVQNLHLVEEPTMVEINIDTPSKVLDFIASDVVWSTE
jgi:type I restriction enzyme M protein